MTEHKKDIELKIRKLEEKIAALQSQLSRETYLQEAFDRANDWIVVLQNDRLQYTNNRITEMTGYSRQEVDQKLFIDFIPASEKEYIKNFLHRIMQGEKVSEEFEIPLIHKEGKLLDVKLSGNLIQYKGAPANLLIIHDITELKNSLRLLSESEAKYRRFFRASNDCVFFTSREGKWLDMSDSAPAFFGYNSKEELMKIPVPDLYENPELRDADLSDIESDGFTRDVPMNLKKKDGSIINTLISSQALRHENGEVYAYQGIIRDITEQKKTERILLENEKNLKELNETKDQFFSLIGHDLRSPFNAIIAYADLLRNSIEQFSKEEVADIAEDLYRTGQETYKLLNNLLEWAGTQSGRIVCEPVVIQVKRMVEKDLSILRENAEKKNIRIDMNIREDLRTYVDKKMFSTIIRNLLDNAIKFTGPKGKISLDANENGRFTEVIISDTGKGMSPATVKKLFKLNTNVRSNGTSGESGSGLGLILCKEFVKLNKGEIHVDSKPGAGTKFTLTFPKKPLSKYEKLMAKS